MEWYILVAIVTAIGLSIILTWYIKKKRELHSILEIWCVYVFILILFTNIACSQYDDAPLTDLDIAIIDDSSENEPEPIIEDVPPLIVLTSETDNTPIDENAEYDEVPLVFGGQMRTASESLLVMGQQAAIEIKNKLFLGPDEVIITSSNNTSNNLNLTLINDTNMLFTA